MTDPLPMSRTAAWIPELRDALGEVIVGQSDLIEGLLLALLTGGHVLLEGVPGIAKSLAVSSLAQGLDGEFARLQFTPDLLPSDLVGSEIYNASEACFTTRRGPIFANFVLADEINRAPAKVQSALLEAMQERQVSIGGETFDLPHPFLVLATQNPIEQEGTYPLPEAQLDRFALKLLVDYPTPSEELEILERMARTGPPPVVRQVARMEDILAARREVDAVAIDPRLKQYIVDLVEASRRPVSAGLAELDGLLLIGASPRATIGLAITAKARAWMEGRDYVIPADIKAIAHRVLRHRVVPNFEAEAEGYTADKLVDRLLEGVRVP
jgi:MoxR-like ATPase